MAEGYDNKQRVDEANSMSNEETSDDSEASSSGEISVDSQHLEWHQIREYDVVTLGRVTKKQKVGPKRPKCDSKKCIISLSGSFALYLCYVCNLFLCGECLLKHDKTHEFVRVESETDERRRMAEMFVGRMRSERLSRLRRGIDFDREDVRVHERVNVKHGLDKDGCLISGLSRLENKSWVALDLNNHCMKIFCSVSNTLFRYIKFGSQPSDATEIKKQQKSTDPDSVSAITTDISGAARYKPDKHNLLAVTFPRIGQIWFIDVNKTPAVKTEIKKMNARCYGIEFSEDKIFTLCQKDVKYGYIWSIYILSTEGNQLKVIQIPGSPALFAHLAVHNGRVFFSCTYDKVLCINVEDGDIISELKLKGSRPAGISVDHNNGLIYLCGRNNDKVYKLAPDLREYEPLSLDTDYTEAPDRLCFINNKLYFSHDRWSSLRNFVTVVQVLT